MTEVEVFKTNVEDPGQALLILEKIHHSFRHYIANFDLEDCDKILRITSGTGMVEAAPVIQLLKSQGFHAEVLPGDDDLWQQNQNDLQVFQ